MYDIIDAVEPYMPEDKPRYLMGVGTPSNIIEGVARGVDFLRLRHARPQCPPWKAVHLEGHYEHQKREIQDWIRCRWTRIVSCPTCRSFSRAYLRHLVKADEMLAMRLLVMHNLWFYNELMQKIRDALDEGRFAEFRGGILGKIGSALVIFRKGLAKFPRSRYNKTNCRV